MTDAFMNIAIRKSDDFHGWVQGGERQRASVLRHQPCGRWRVGDRKCLSGTRACFDRSGLYTYHVARPTAVLIHRIFERESEIVRTRAVDVRWDRDPHGRTPNRPGTVAIERSNTFRRERLPERAISRRKVGVKSWTRRGGRETGARSGKSIFPLQWRRTGSGACCPGCHEKRY